ncbi:MAG: hypothetical protein ACJ780_30910 [Solirubrobacteraceae bacterium]
MAKVAELSAPYANVMLGPRHGPDVCWRCFDLTNGARRCYHCARAGQWVDVMAPVSYCVGGEQLHHALAGYKRLAGEPARYLTVGLAAVLWRHLASHEQCLAWAAGVDTFELVTTVPSSDRGRDERHPLHRLVGELVGPARGRYERLLRRTDTPVHGHRFSADRYAATRELQGSSVLLVDDTWTTGANAHSAATALKAAGARRVAAVVIGRYLNREYGHNDRRLRSVARPFDWDTCALCDSAPGKPDSGGAPTAAG